MPENPKRKSTDRKETREPAGTLADDQKDRGYYYDDAHGYEKFDPETDEEDEDADDEQLA